MKPKAPCEEPAQLFQQDLEHLLDQRQALYKIVQSLTLGSFGKEF